MQHLEVNGAVRHTYIYVCVIRRLKVKASRSREIAEIYEKETCQTKLLIAWK